MPGFWTILFLFTTIMLAGLLVGNRRSLAHLKEQVSHLEGELSEQQSESWEKLAEERARQAALFDSMTEGVLLLDRDGRVFLVNRTLEQLFGISNNIRGNTIMEAFRFHELKELVERLLVEKKLEGSELELPGLEKRILSVNASVVLDSKGISQGMILVFHDLTRVKELENTRKEFVANVSHELRTPLSMIKGYVETLVDGASQDPDVAGKFLQTIQKHTDRLTYLIEDLLTISRLESGQIQLNPEVMDLSQKVNRLIEELKVKAGGRRVALRNLVEEGTLIRADTDRLHQVMINLLDNSIKYGKEGGEVVISAEANGKGKLKVCIKDDGPGIPEEARERIFERFYRVDRARSREQGGTGLGLSIVKHIIQSHGGEVWVESDPGEGASFFFTLNV